MLCWLRWCAVRAVCPLVVARPGCLHHGRYGPAGQSRGVSLLSSPLAVACGWLVLLVVYAVPFCRCWPRCVASWPVRTRRTVTRLVLLVTTHLALYFFSSCRQPRCSAWPVWNRRTVMLPICCRPFVVDNGGWCMAGFAGDDAHHLVSLLQFFFFSRPLASGSLLFAAGLPEELRSGDR